MVYVYDNDIHVCGMPISSIEISRGLKMMIYAISRTGPGGMKPDKTLELGS